MTLLVDFAYQRPRKKKATGDNFAFFWLLRKSDLKFVPPCYIHGTDNRQQTTDNRQQATDMGVYVPT